MNLPHPWEIHLKGLNATEFLRVGVHRSSKELHALALQLFVLRYNKRSVYVNQAFLERPCVPQRTVKERTGEGQAEPPGTEGYFALSVNGEQVGNIRFQPL